MTQTKHSPSQRMKRNQRDIIRRLIIRGLLVLESPTCLGSGDADSPTDMPLLRDSISQNALLTGASIAGALRNYLREYKHDYNVPESKTDLATTLFGCIRGDNDGDQSSLIIYDSISSTLPTLELRDGVKIDSKTGTAADKAKYDLELLAAGTNFPLIFELLIDQTININSLLEGLAIALQGLEKGEISLGMKKRRGFGRCHVEKWQVWQFNLENADERLAWLTYDHWTPGLVAGYPLQDSIAAALGVQLDEKEDKRDRLILQATFNLEGSLLIRSGQADTKPAPDVVHLKSKRNGQPIPVLSGTSLAGVLRHRAERIVNTLQNTSGQEPQLVTDLFGNAETNQSQSSRIIVHEAEIKETQDLVQNRIAIDRFTGGAYQGALFDEQPVWGNDKSHLTTTLEVRNPSDAEIGLLLLLLKDLWTGDLPVGGESSIGRGRLKGKQATITRRNSGVTTEWSISEDKEGFQVSDAGALEALVQALVRHISEKRAA